MDIYKYQAAGNDFVLMQPEDSNAELTVGQVRKLCDRRFGIGADGLIIMKRSDDCDFTMQFYNNDGSSGMMCGNGGRCIVDLAWRSGIAPSGDGGSWIFRAPDGIHHGRIVSASGNCSQVRLGMNGIQSVKCLKLPGIQETAFRMNTGTEHLVIFCNDLDTLDVCKEGRKWRFDPMFAPGGVNVNFVQPGNDGTARVRTYERGVEYETLSCGTGIIASAVALHIRNGCPENSGYTILSTMHSFTVSFRYHEGIFGNVEIEGPVELVFKTSITL